MGIKVNHVGREKFKSIYELQLYEIISPSKTKYRLNDDERREYYNGMPGFSILGTDIGYFETLAKAEKRIRQIAAENRRGLYGFVVREKALGYVVSGMNNVSVRRYLKDGTLWQACTTSGIIFCDRKNMELGDSGFYGRDPKTIRFKEGDIVEIAYEEFVELAIVWQTPATKEQMKPVWNAIRKEGVKKPYGSPGILDDHYVVAVFNPYEEKVFRLKTDEPATVNVLPPSHPVPRTLAAKLRKVLEQVKKEEKDFIPF